MAAGTLSGKTKIDGVDTPGIIVEAFERGDKVRSSTVRRTISDGTGSWSIPGVDDAKTYDVIMRAPGKKSVISDSRAPVTGSVNTDGHYSKVVLQTSFDNLVADDFGNAMVTAGSPTIVNDTTRGNCLNIPAESGHSLKFNVVNGGPLDLNGDNYTVEFWLKCPVSYGSHGFCLSMGGGFNYQYHALALRVNPNTNQSDWGARSREAEATGAGPDISNYRGINSVVNPGPLIGKWVHYALTRDEDKFRVWIDGNLRDGIDRTSSSRAWYPLQKYTNNTGISLGAPFWSNTGLPQEGLQCLIDDFRITRACRYTTNFTPPASIYSF